MRRIFILVVLALMFATSPLPVKAGEVGYDWYGYNSYLPTAGTFFRIPPPVTTGWAVSYIPGEMEATAQYRGYPLEPQLPYLGYVAAMTPAMIGWPVWLKRPGNTWEGPYLVVDCPRRNDQYGLIEYKQEVVEVDFNTALRWGFVTITGLDDNAHYAYTVNFGGIPNVEVSYYPPSNYMPSAVVYRNWYKSIFTSGPKVEYIVEDIPLNPSQWCITTAQTCEGAWRRFVQPVPYRNDGIRKMQ